MQLRSGRRTPTTVEEAEAAPLRRLDRHMRQIVTNVVPELAASNPEQTRYDAASYLVELLGSMSPAPGEAEDSDHAPFVSALLEVGGFRHIAGLVAPSAAVRLREEGCGVLRLAFPLEAAASDPRGPRPARFHPAPAPCTAEERVARQLGSLLVGSASVIPDVVALLQAGSESVKGAAWAAAAVLAMLRAEEALLSSGRGGAGLMAAVLAAGAAPGLVRYLQALLRGKKGLDSVQGTAPWTHVSLEERMSMDDAEAETYGTSLERARADVDLIERVMLAAEGRVDGIWAVAALGAGGATAELVEAGAVAVLLDLLEDGIVPTAADQAIIGVPVMFMQTGDALEQSQPVLDALQALRADSPTVFFEALITCGGVQRLKEAMEANGWYAEDCQVSEDASDTSDGRSTCKAKLRTAWRGLLSEAESQLQTQMVALAFEWAAVQAEKDGEKDGEGEGGIGKRNKKESDKQTS